MKQLHQKLFWLLILFLPVQLARHFWPEWSYVLGLRVDYLSPTIYLTDLLVLGILGSWFWEKRKTKFGLKKVLKKFWWIIAFLVFLLVNVSLAQNSPAAFYQLVRLVLLVSLGFYLARNRYSLTTIRTPLSLAVIYSSLIAMIQFFKQASLEGAFWWLGERTFSVITPGIAKTSLAGRLFLRPYATFPHPNVLAGFILVTLILTNEDTLKLTGKKLIGYLALVLGMVALVLSFSRSVWLVGIFAGLWLNINYLRKIRANKKIILLAIFGWFLILSLLAFFVFELSFKEAIGQRVELTQAAIRMIKNHPLFGAGLNNFIVRLPGFWGNLGLTYWLQPAHNIYLLLAAEIGLVGLMVFSCFMILTYRRLSKKLFSSRLPLIAGLTAILLLGFFDHYWLTLHQTQLLFTIVLGLSWSDQGQ